MITSTQPEVLKKKAKDADKKLEILMSMYHRLSYAKVLKMAIEYGIVTPVQKQIPHADIVEAVAPENA